VPFPSAQKASKKAMADDTSAVWLEHEYFADELITDRASWEFLFLVHAQLARAGASDGHSEFVCNQMSVPSPTSYFSRNRRELTRELETGQ